MNLRKSKYVRTFVYEIVLTLYVILWQVFVLTLYVILWQVFVLTLYVILWQVFTSLLMMKLSMHNNLDI
jgi:hypothetical protein